MKAEMVLVEQPPITLADVPVWTSCRVKYRDGEFVRYLRPDGFAGEVLSDGKIRYCSDTNKYLVLEILGPLPSHNKPEDARLPGPLEPVRLSELPPWVFTKVHWNGLGVGQRCHDGEGHAWSIKDQRLHLAHSCISHYTVVPGSPQWQLRITVPKGEGADDGKH